MRQKPESYVFTNIFIVLSIRIKNLILWRY